MEPPPPVVGREFPFARAKVVADGVKLSVVDDGPRDARETLLFVHGNPVWGFLWRKLLAQGIAAGFRVVAPDQAGFGMSAKPPDAAYHTLDRHVRNLEAVAEQRGLRDATLVMHDWGGPIGMGLAARRPGLVKRLVAANTTAFAPRRARAFTPWHAFFSTAPGQALGVRANMVARTALRFGVRRPLPREVRDAYLWPMRERGARLAAARFVAMVPDGPDHPTSATLRGFEERFGALQDKPLLVLWADRDPVFPPARAERWLRDFPRARVEHASATAGHFWQEDDPAPFAGRILRFAGS